MRQVPSVVTIAMAALILVGCGASNVRVTPASADAKNFPGGVVPFAATGVTNPIWCIGSRQSRKMENKRQMRYHTAADLARGFHNLALVFRIRVAAWARVRIFFVLLACALCVS